jgi:hypothetical protein
MHDAYAQDASRRSKFLLLLSMACQTNAKYRVESNRTRVSAASRILSGQHCNVFRELPGYTHREGLIRVYIREAPSAYFSLQEPRCSSPSILLPFRPLHKPLPKAHRIKNALLPLPLHPQNITLHINHHTSLTSSTSRNPKQRQPIRLMRLP